jgi:predicted peptidase
MHRVLVGILLFQAAVVPRPRITNQTFSVAGIGTISYGLATPAIDRQTPKPLILALHPNGSGQPYYGSAFMRQIILPALGDLQAVIVAPDCPARSWNDPTADRAVLALVEKIRNEYVIDSRRILVTGFSMGGRGTWFMAAHHADLFTAAIPMAASIGDEPIDRLGLVPTYIIHSRNDRVVPFDPAEQNARRLEALGRPIRFEELREPSHYQMGGYIDALHRAGQWVAEKWK